MTAVIERRGDEFVLQLGVDERDVVVRLLGELREMLESSGARSAPVAGAAVSEEVLMRRLFPVVHPDDAEAEAEYQHLMRSELVTSRVAAIDAVVGSLTAERPTGRRRPRAVMATLSEPQVITFMQAVNAVRLVLGTMLDINDEDDEEPPADGEPFVAEYHLYAYLSWLLDSAVMALTELEPPAG